MANIFSKIFSKPLDPNKIIDFTMGGLDRLNFSNQERAEYNLKLAEALAEYTQKTLDESTDKSITRRYLSVIIVAIYMFLCLFTVAASLFNPEIATMVMTIIDEFYMTTAFIMVLAFFYGGYYISGIVKQKK
jgi:Fe2+ transport system protein B